MSETAKRLEPGFSVADADYPSLTLRGGTLTVEFVDWREHHVRVSFLEAAGVKWQELDSTGPEDRNDEVFEIMGSSWLAEYLRADATSAEEALRHFRLCFNTCGVLDVLASSMDVRDAG